jgi:hypothetical protein
MYVQFRQVGKTKGVYGECTRSRPDTLSALKRRNSVTVTNRKGNIVTILSDYRRDLGLDTGFIDHLQVVTVTS